MDLGFADMDFVEGNRILAGRRPLWEVFQDLVIKICCTNAGAVLLYSLKATLVFL